MKSGRVRLRPTAQRNEKERNAQQNGRDYICSAHSRSRLSEHFSPLHTSPIKKHAKRTKTRIATLITSLFWECRNFCIHPQGIGCKAHVVFDRLRGKSAANYCNDLYWATIA